MKIKIILSITAITWMMVAGCNQNQIDKSEEEAQVTTKSTLVQEGELIWDYPVKPGMVEWASFTTGKQMIDACQIPQDVLDKICTSDLVAICLNYPLFGDYTAANDKRKGISFLIETFNGFKELSIRKDGVLELIKTYKSFPVLDYLPDELSINYHTPYKLPFLEMLIADDIFINQLDRETAVELEQISLDKYASKLDNSEVYSLYNIKHTMLLWAVVADTHNPTAKTPEQLKTVKRFIVNYSNAFESSLLTEISLIMSSL